MTIWKAIAILIHKIGSAITPCRHEWNDYGTFNEKFGSVTVGQKMIQRCENCGKYRRLKIY